MSFPSSHREIVCRSWTWRPVPLASKHVLSPPQAIPPACPGVPICQNRSYCNGDFMKVHFDPLEIVLLTEGRMAEDQQWLSVEDFS